MWSRPSRNRIFPCQDQVEIRSGISRPQHSGLMERVSDRSDARFEYSPEDGKRVPQQMRWELIPWWAKDSKIGFSSINARAETVATTPAFRDAWKSPALSGYHGRFLRVEEARKQPYAVAMADDRHMVMAGLWDEWTDKKTGERIKSCTVITIPQSG